jgi:hypothetical protein
MAGQFALFDLHTVYSKLLYWNNRYQVEHTRNIIRHTIARYQSSILNHPEKLRSTTRYYIAIAVKFYATP